MIISRAADSQKHPSLSLRCIEASRRLEVLEGDVRELVLKGKTAAAKTKPPAAAAEGAGVGPMEKRPVDRGAVKKGKANGGCFVSSWLLLIDVCGCARFCPGWKFLLEHSG